MAKRSYLSIITLNVNGLNAPTKRQRLAEWIQKQDPYICCLQETHLKTRDTYRLEVKGWKKIFHANRDQKKGGVAILISDKIDFQTKAVKRDKEGRYTSVSLLVSCIQGYHYHLSKFHIYVLVYSIGVFLSGLLHSV